jgi:NitT/TauT family transport system permease protein
MDVSDVAVSGPDVHAQPRAWQTRYRRVTILGLRVVIVAAAIGLWQLMSGPVLPTFAISKPSAIVVSLGSLLGSSAGWADIKTTAFEVLVGFAIGVGIGAVTGVILGALSFVGQVFEPLVSAVNSIPKLALAPVFLLFFGIGDWSKVAIAATSIAFVMFYAVYFGMSTVRRELVDIVKVMGASRWSVLKYVTLPSLITPFMAGLKTSGPLAVVSVVVGEFLVSYDGIGHQLYVDSSNLNAAAVFADIVVLVVITLAINAILGLLYRIVEHRLGMAKKNLGDERICRR